jgi:hypothetical protein
MDKEELKRIVDSCPQKHDQLLHYMRDISRSSRLYPAN